MGAAILVILVNHYFVFKKKNFHIFKGLIFLPFKTKTHGMLTKWYSDQWTFNAFANYQITSHSHEYNVCHTSHILWSHILTTDKGVSSLS